MRNAVSSTLQHLRDLDDLRVGLGFGLAREVHSTGTGREGKRCGKVSFHVAIYPYILAASWKLTGAKPRRWCLFSSARKSVYVWGEVFAVRA